MLLSDLYDEAANIAFVQMLAYLIAGHDTTSNTLTWGLLYLTDNQEPQLTLRKHLHTVFADAVAEKRQPTSQEITKTQAPYLDAVVEEILRLSVVIPMLSRQATVDTTVLGYHIPKDTSVMLISNGPSFHQPGMPVDESL
jgi:cytochrome P450